MRVRQSVPGPRRGFVRRLFGCGRKVRSGLLLCCVEKAGGGVLGSLGSRATQDSLSNRIYGCLGLIDAVEGCLGSGTNSCVISTSGFIDDGLKRALSD
jgi:hypothetical protein